MKRIKTEFKVLKAYNGDCILIKTFNEKHEEFIILIDGGTASTFDYSLKRELKKLSKIDLLVLTHIDSDHIGGLIKLFKNSIIQNLEILNIWVNNPELVKVESGELISYKQASSLKKLILDKVPNAKINNRINTFQSPINFGGISLKILSPSVKIFELLYKVWSDEETLKKEINIKANVSSSIESSTYNTKLKELSKIEFVPINSLKTDIINSSSISFILNCSDISLLLLADSRPEIIVEELRKLGYKETNKLRVNYVKVSHHGSKNNTSQELLNLIECDNYIISTNGGSSSHKHPSRETIARIIYNENRDFNTKINIFLNYPLESIKNRVGEFINENDLEDGNWQLISKNEF